MTATAFDKGKGKLIHDEESADSPFAPPLELDSDDEITPEYLESLLERARRNAASSSGARTTSNDEEDVITLEGSTEE